MWSALEEDPDGVSDASVDGRNFAVSGGVAKSVENVIREKYPDREIKMANAEGLKECRKLLTMAKAGKYNGYLLEGMACPGGCVAGAGTMQSIKKSQAAVNKYAAQAKHKISSQTEYVKRTGQAGRLKRTARWRQKSEKRKKKDGLCGSDSCNGTSVCRMRPDRDKDGEQHKKHRIRKYSIRKYADREQHSGIGNRR